MTCRVGITGLGVISAAGSSRHDLADAAASGRSALSSINDSRVAHFRGTHAGQIVELPQGVSADHDRHIVLAILAAREAVAESGLLPLADGRVLGVVHATCSGPMHTIESHYIDMLREQKAPSPSDVAARAYDSGAHVLAREFGASGPVLTVTTACSASTCAIGTARDLIAQGAMDVALVGGADAFSLTTLAGFDALKATAEGPCAPFSQPVGMCLGEAGAYAILERTEDARERGATILTEVLGFGASNDAYHCSSPDPGGKGSAQAMTRALADAGAVPAGISYVNAHGTGTESNDKAESKAVRLALGDEVESIPMSSVKAVAGHCLGAAGVLEIAATIGCAQRGVLPPTVNYVERRDGCGLDYVAEAGRAWSGEQTFMSNNLAFGGNNASVVMSMGEGAGPGAQGTPVPELCITGCSLVSARGLDVAAAGLAADAVVPDAATFDLRRIDRRVDTRGMDKASQFAIAASSLALSSAGLQGRKAARAGVGLYMHCTHAPVWAESEHVCAVMHNEFRTDSLAAFPYVVPNSVCGNTARALSLSGHNATFCLGPGGALAGLGLAASAVRAGHADVLLSVAADERPGGILGQSLLPGREDEGASAFLIEPHRKAAERGAPVLAHINGVGFASGPNALQGAVEQALRAAGIGPDQVWAVCCDSREESTVDGLTTMGQGLESCIVDMGSSAGYPTSCGASLTLAMLLLSVRIEAESRRKYILSLLGSSDRQCSAVVIQRAADKD